ncbi:hypothetical protein B9Z55_007876 [Caenorhabditis nigoni]|nr:hypothetical protein B9Z55_007876 [Caenorhabditis nigoni]
MLFLGLLAIVAPLALGAPPCFDEVNRLKEAYAYKFNIASMNKVQYMEHLERSIDYGLEMNGECPEPTFALYDEAYFLNARENTTIFEDMVIGFNYRYMACKVTYCPRTGKEIVSYAAQIVTIQHNRKLNGPPASKCHETWPVPKGGLCAGAEEMTQRERQQRNARDYLEYLNRKREEEKRSESKYGRKSAVPLKCFPGETEKTMPGCYQEKPVEYKPIDWEEFQKTMDKFVDSLIAKKGKN